MQNTTNYNLKKPDLTDYVNISDLNDNADVIDQKLKENVDAITMHKTESASTIQKGHVQLSTATNSTSTTLAATPSAVKSTYDLANGKYAKPGLGIPKTDLVSAVQTSLGKADSALQSVPDGTTSAKGVVQLSNNISGQSQLLVATEKAVNDAKDAAVTGADANSKAYSVNAINIGTTDIDPNTTENPYILSIHANTPSVANFWHIRTYFYASKKDNRSQMAISYSTGGKKALMYIRECVTNVWGAWVRILDSNMLGIANGVAKLNANGKVINADGSETGNAKIVSGTYTGNATANRFIDVGFPVKFVAISRLGITNIMHLAVIDAETNNRLDSSGAGAWNGRIQGNGFSTGLSGSVGPNASGVPYSYVAMG